MTAMDEVARRVETRLAREPGVLSVSTWVGSGVPRFYLPLDQIFPQTNVSQMILLPEDLAARERIRKALPELLATEFPEVRGRVKLLPNGPPVTYPVQFRVVGTDPVVLRGLADEMSLLLMTIVDENALKADTPDELRQVAGGIAEKAYRTRESEFTPEVTRELEKHLYLFMIDEKWREHLHELDHLKGNEEFFVLTKHPTK